MEEAWRSYEYLRLEGSLHTIPMPELVTFAEKVAAHADTGRTGGSDSYRRQWGSRLSSILRDTESRLQRAASQSVLPIVGRCLMSRALALMDQMDDALELCHDIEAHTLQKANERHYLRMYQTILLVLSEREGSPSAIRFLLDEWENLQKYFPPDTRDYQKELVPYVHSFREAVWDIAKKLEDVEQFFGSADHSRSPEWRRRAGAFLIRLFCERGFPLDAAAAIEAFRSRKEAPPWEELMLAVKTLVKHEAFDAANTLFLEAGHQRSSTDPHGSSAQERKWSEREANLYHKTGLYLYAHQGDPVSADRCFNAVSPARRASPADIALLIHAYALVGDVESAVGRLAHYTSNGNLRPNIIHYSGIILAHAKTGDFAGMEEWIGKMAQAGFRPDRHVYSIILQGFAERGDSSSVGKILDWMRDAKQPLSAHTATSVIAMLARKKDLHGAEGMFRRSVDEGIVPDRQMVTAIMNAHVEAGNWSGVISTFDYLKAAASEKRSPLTVQILNTLLKAYVLAGAPWAVIGALHGYMKDTGTGADAYTYSLLIQAACDNGHMSTAHKWYDELRKRASTGQSHLRINIFALTILMAGWLKQADRKQAMQIYESMLRQGIQPTPITLYHIIKAYSDQKTRSSLETALAFLQELMGSSSDKSWLATNRGYTNGLNGLYGPLLTAYAQQKNPKRVEELIRDMERQGGRPSLGNLTALLDAYRRTSNLEGVRRTWSRIYDVALSSSTAASFLQTSNTHETRSRGPILCVPLSIYLDALSSAGEHAEVVPTWKLLTDSGFTVDANNWNQLVVAAIRAGQPMRAFQILQDILIPQQRRAEQLRGRDENSVPASHVSEGDDFTTGSEGSSRDKGRRAVNTRLEQRRLTYLMYKLRQAPNDSATPLHAMYRISPAWSDWGAHPKVLELLLETLGRLMAGGFVTQVPKGGGTPSPRRGWIDGINYGWRGFARQNLKHIVATYPDAVALVLRWRNNVDRIQGKTSLPQTQPTQARSSLSRQIRSARAWFVKGERLRASKRSQRSLSRRVATIWPRKLRKSIPLVQAEVPYSDVFPRTVSL